MLFVVEIMFCSLHFNLFMRHEKPYKRYFCLLSMFHPIMTFIDYLLGKLPFDALSPPPLAILDYRLLLLVGLKEW